jgi:hypothetical protein
MAVNASSLGGPKPQFEDANGAPISGGKLYFFAAGSTTPQNTYTDSTGATPNAHPIVLNSRGEPPNEIWFTAGLSYKGVLKDSADVTIWTIDNISGVNDVSGSLDEWKTGPAPTFVSTTSFTVAGDQTTTFTVGRRLKTTNSGGTIYSTITASSFGAGVTTVTVANDSGVLDSGLSAVSYGVLSSANSSIPSLKLSSGVWTLQNALAMSGAAINEAQGSDIASAATINIDSATGNVVDVTGTTTITAITLSQGRERTVLFTGALTLTHGASLVLPGAANITTAAGDYAIFRGYAAGVVRCVNYMKPAGAQTIQTQTANTVLAGPTSGGAALPTFRALVAADGGTHVLLATATASASASLTFTALSSTYDEYLAVLVNVVPATNSAKLLMRMSIDGGSTYKSGATDYQFANLTFGADAVAQNGASTGATSINLAFNGDNSAANGGFNGEVRIFGVNNTNARKFVTELISFNNSAVGCTFTTGGGMTLLAALQTSAVNAIQFIMDSGNITSGSIYLYGIRKT